MDSDDSSLLIAVLDVHSASTVQLIMGNLLRRQNHAVNYNTVALIDQELNKTGSLIREAMWIRQSSNMDRDEGSYQLSDIRKCADKFSTVLVPQAGYFQYENINIFFK